MKRIVTLSVLGCLLVGCSGDRPAAGSSRSAAALAPFQLGSKPEGAVAVLAAKQVPAGEPIVVVGRISSTVKGLAAFTLTDERLPYCGQRTPEDNCPTPWDYCCEDGETKSEHTLTVEARGADGRPVAADELTGLRLLDLVVVKGKIERDAHGNVAVIADGWFRAERPDLREGLNWPQ